MYRAYVQAAGTGESATGAPKIQQSRSGGEGTAKWKYSGSKMKNYREF